MSESIKHRGVDNYRLRRRDDEITKLLAESANEMAEIHAARAEVDSAHRLATASIEAD